MTEKEAKEAYEAGYRAACMEHGIPYVGVTHTYGNILRLNLSCPLNEFLSSMNYKDVIVSEVIKSLDKWYNENYLKKQ